MSAQYISTYYQEPIKNAVEIALRLHFLHPANNLLCCSAAQMGWPADAESASLPTRSLSSGSPRRTRLCSQRSCRRKPLPVRISGLLIDAFSCPHP